MSSISLGKDLRHWPFPLSLRRCTPTWFTRCAVATKRSHFVRQLFCFPLQFFAHIGFCGTRQVEPVSYLFLRMHAENLNSFELLRQKADEAPMPRALATDV